MLYSLPEVNIYPQKKMCLHSEVGLLQQVWVCGRRIQEFDGFINQFKGRLALLLEQGSKQD
jgi:hypothetical protein